MRIGIDLGTTYSLTATLNPRGVPLLLSDAQEKDLFHTPSRVCLTPDGALVGHMAETMQAAHPKLPLIRFFKRYFGEAKSLCFDAKGQDGQNSQEGQAHLARQRALVRSTPVNGLL